jgi:hypothetical protein
MNRVIMAALLASVALVCLASTVCADTGSLAGKLQLTLDLESYAWPPGAYAPRALVVLGNVSADTVVFDTPTAGPRTENTYDRTQWLVMTDQSGQSVSSDDVGIIAELPAGVEWIPTVSLAPGESHCYFISLIWWGYDLAELNLAPGIYTVRAVYEYFDVPRPAFDDEEERRQWMDENHQLLFSNVVQLEILGQGGKAPETIRLARDGTPVEKSVPRMLIKGHVVADARLFTDAGVKVSRESGNATMTREDNQVTLPVGRWPKEMKDKHPPAIPVVGGGLMVPVRYVAEALGMKVVWDPKTKTANIISG